MKKLHIAIVLFILFTLIIDYSVNLVFEREINPFLWDYNTQKTAIFMWLTIQTIPLAFYIQNLKEIK